MPITAEQIETAAMDPQQVTGDEGTVIDKSADDKIKLMNYAAAQTNAENAKPSIRIFKVVPPGTV